MSASFTQLLELVGRLDDQPGFDSARERLRRYLTEEITELHLARTLVDEGQHALGEQPHRAMQDVITILGRFLGFETAFGSYQRADRNSRHHGLWRSRRHLNVVLDVFTDQTARADFDDPSKELVSVPSDLLVDPDTPTLALVVVTPLFPGRARLEEMVDDQLDPDERRVVSADCLVGLATLVTEGEVSHEEVVQLLRSSREVDLVARLLMRVRRTEASDVSADLGAHSPADARVAIARRRAPVESIESVAAISRGPRSLE